MPNDVHDQRRELDQLVEDYTGRGVSRREFLRRATVLGLSLSAAGALLEACGGGNNGTSVTQSKSVDLVNVWTGPEQDSFNAVVAPWKQQTGNTIKLETTRDLDTLLTSRLQANNPPDMAVLPNPGKMQQLAKEGKLVKLDTFLDMSQIRKDYASSLVDLGSYKGNLYAIFYKAANKAMVWYSPTQFTSNNYQVPATWQDMITLSTNIANSGKFPWSMGVAAQAASGFPSADWIAQIFLNNSGPDLYDKWVAHQIKWTDPSISQAFQMFGQIAHGPNFINGAPQSILATGFQQASFLPFTTPPQAYMYYEADFIESFLTAQFPNAKAGTDFNFFPFPTINQQFAGAITGGADVVVALKNTTAVQSLMKYMATAQAQEIWVKRGGFTSLNKSVDLSAYPDPVAQASAKQLASAPIFRFGADDLMPSAVEDAFWTATLNYISHPDQLSSILDTMESTAVQAYGS